MTLTGLRDVGEQAFGSNTLEPHYSQPPIHLQPQSVIYTPYGMCMLPQRGLYIFTVLGIPTLADWQ